MGSSSLGFSSVPGNWHLGSSGIILDIVSIFHTMEFSEYITTFKKYTFSPYVVLTIIGLSWDLFFSSVCGTQIFVDPLFISLGYKAVY